RHFRQGREDLLFGEIDVLQRLVKEVFQLLFLGHGRSPVIGMLVNAAAQAQFPPAGKFRNASGVCQLLPSQEGDKHTWHANSSPFMMRIAGRSKSWPTTGPRPFRNSWTKPFVTCSGNTIARPRCARR